MTKSLDQLRRDAKALKRSYEAGETLALQRLKIHPPRKDGADLRHSDFLHVIAREQSFISWPALKEAVETNGMDRAQKLQRLKMALANGQNARVDALLWDTPDLAKGHFGLQVALLNREVVAGMLEEEPDLAAQEFGGRRPIIHLAYSSRIHAQPERTEDMIAIAEMLLANGADVNDSYRYSTDSDYRLPVLYGAIGHAKNMVLARWLLEHGANPNDQESLYHSTELGHHEGLKMLLEHGADPKGTNALLRAMDFHDHEAVQLLLNHGAKADDFDGTHVGGEAPWVVPALHQAARRGADARMVAILLNAGADPHRVYQGASAYGYALVHGNEALAQEIAARGDVPELTREEQLLALAAKGDVPEGQFFDPEKLPEAYRNIIRTIIHLPGRLDQVKALVALGVEYDRPDTEGLTPVQVAGWEGLPEAMGYMLSLKPDLSHVNGYGGTLFSTIIHGSENCPQRGERDYVACLKLALEAGVALPQRAMSLVGEEDVAAFLADWAEAHPGQVVEYGAY